MSYDGPMCMSWKSPSTVAYEGSCGYKLSGVRLSQYKRCGGVYRRGVTIQTSRGSAQPDKELADGSLFQLILPNPLCSIL